MKYWLTIKDKLNGGYTIALQLLLFNASFYVLTLIDEHRFWKIPILFAGLFVWFFFRHKIKHPTTWILLAFILFLELLSFYFLVANHHFMLLCLVLSVIFFKYHRREDIFEKNIQLVLCIVIIASVIHKITSPDFSNGSFYYYSINTGSFFKEIFYIFPDYLDITKENSEKITTFNAIDPNLNQKVILKDIIPNLARISLVFARFTVIVESLVAIAILWKPKSFFTHLLLIIMILGVLITRLETGFMTLLSITGLFLCRYNLLKFIYVIIAIGCMTLVITKIGYS